MEFVCGDILQPHTLKPAMDGIDALIHAAGLAHIFDKSKTATAPFKAVNEIGTLNTARAAAQAGVKHFVLISSVAVYGGSREGGHEDSGCRPEGPYAESKYLAELRAIEVARDAGMALTILRLATLYGEGDPGNVARLMRTIDRRRFVWVGNGSNRKSLLHRDDAARACLAVLGAARAGIEIFNVSAPPYLMRDIVVTLAAALGRRLPVWRVPPEWALAATRQAGLLPFSPFQNLRATVEKWLADDAYSAARFQTAYDYRTRVDLVEGLRREVAWYRESAR
jgi:nucleoside-diphosphate-sugar epimerase